MSKELKVSSIILMVMLTLVALSWVYAVVFTWDELAAMPVRMAQLVTEPIYFIIPGIVAGFALWQRKSWAKVLFVYSLGAFLYASSRTVAYLYWDNYLGVPWIGALIYLLAFTGFAIFAMWVVVKK